MKSLAILIAWVSLLNAGMALANPLVHSFECQKQVDMELERLALPDFERLSSSFTKVSKAIDRDAFKRNEAGQYSAYLMVEDAASKSMIGELIQDRSDDEVPADQVVTLGDRSSPKLTVFLKGKRIVAYGVDLSKDGISKGVRLDPGCAPRAVKLAFGSNPRSFGNPVIDLNRTDCSHLAALEAVAKDVEIEENDRFFDAVCRLRGGKVSPESDLIDEDVSCQCESGPIDPELEKWKGEGKTCLTPPEPARADIFASLITYKASLVNGGFQALVTQLRKRDSTIAQQCAIHFPP